MARQKIKIRLRAYESAVLDRSAEVIVSTALKTGALVRGPIPLPTRKTIYTVLRSPHVDKKSREQFEMRVELITPIAMEEGLRFAIREGGRTVGAGVVAEIFE